MAAEVKRRVAFIDTSVLCNLVRVPGRDQHSERITTEFAERAGQGELFVIPVTAVIETGNHIAQATGDRRAAADRLVGLLRAAMAESTPWKLNAATWDDRFLTELCAGNGTGQGLVDLLGNGQLGTGDVAILTERDQFRARTDFAAVSVWSLDQGLAAYS